MRRVRWIVCVMALAALASSAWRPLCAQDSPIPTEVSALLDDIADIDKLRILNQLKLKPDEIDRIIAAVEKSQRDYNKALADATVPPIRGIATDIRATRQKMLAGASIPKDFDEKVKQLQDDYVKRRDNAQADTLSKLSGALRAIITQDQLATAASIARKALTENGTPTAKGTDDQFFNYFVLKVFVGYPRIVPLLQDMKKAQTGDKAGTGG